MKPAGGYFELALSEGSYRYHDTSYALKSGRASLHAILLHIKPALVYIPFYTCNALIEPFEITGVPYRFYEIDDNLEPIINFNPGPGEYFLYVNYFDIKRDCVKQLSEKYGDKLIVDCTQAFFMKGNGTSWFFNSCRKFFGVPDGSYLYVPEGTVLPQVQSKNENYIIDHLLQRFNGHVSEGYSSFVENEECIDSAVTGMSLLSGYLLSNINYQTIIDARRANYRQAHKKFAAVNLFNAAADKESVPMYYPLLLSCTMDKTYLAGKQIFIPSFWQDVIKRDIPGYAKERSLAERLLPLPADQRYTPDDINTMAEVIFDRM